MGCIISKSKQSSNYTAKQLESDYLNWLRTCFLIFAVPIVSSISNINRIYLSILYLFALLVLILTQLYYISNRKVVIQNSDTISIYLDLLWWIINFFTIFVFYLFVKCFNVSDNVLINNSLFKNAKF